MSEPMTYERVDEIFNALFEELQELNGEAAPDTFTWYARDREGLIDASDGRAGWEEGDEPVTMSVGGSGPIVAWAWESNAGVFAAFREDTPAADVEYVLRAFMNLLGPPTPIELA